MADDSTLRITAGGIDYSIDLSDFTPRDARDFRAACGTNLVQAITAPDLDHIAAFIWLQRRRTEPKVTLAQVEAGITLGSVSAPEDDAEDEDAAPEA